MKQLSLLALALLSALATSAKPPVCKTVRTGTFRMTSPNGVTTLITRTANRQTELMSNSTQQTAYTVKWLSDCTYELIPEASFFAKYPAAPRNARLMVRILSVSQNGYQLESRLNLRPEVMRSEAVRVK